MIGVEGDVAVAALRRPDRVIAAGSCVGIDGECAARPGRQSDVSTLGREDRHRLVGCRKEILPGRGGDCPGAMGVISESSSILMFPLDERTMLPPPSMSP